MPVSIRLPEKIEKRLDRLGARRPALRVLVPFHCVTTDDQWMSQSLKPHSGTVFPSEDEIRSTGGYHLVTWSDLTTCMLFLLAFRRVL